MKRIIFTLALLIMISSATAIFGGESATIYEEDCVVAYVNITGNQTIETGEFSLNSNCTFESKWIYNCTCDEHIVFTPEVNAINTYFISTDIWKEKEEPTEEIISSSGSNYRSSHNYEHQDEIIRATPKVIEEQKEIIIESDEKEEEEKPIIITEEKVSYTWLWVTILIIVVVLGIGYFIFRDNTPEQVGE